VITRRCTSRTWSKPPATTPAITSECPLRIAGVAVHLPGGDDAVPRAHEREQRFRRRAACLGVLALALQRCRDRRFRNPTVDVAAEEVRRLEAAEAAFSGFGQPH
jgi:hypothetical protein